MITQNLNLNHLRIFECVYRTGSMTEASRELHLTQSGVSQHIRSFESVLGIRLFDRVKQKLVPTSAAITLFERGSRGMLAIEQAILEIQGQDPVLTGQVRIGMPIEFGNHHIVPLLSQFAAKHPKVDFQIRLGFASEMNEMLLKGTLDFAFVDDFQMNRRIRSEPLFNETLELCIHRDCLKDYGYHPKKCGKTFFESLDYVEYEKDEPVLRMWFGHHLGSRHLRLRIRVYVMDVQGIARMIEHRMGAGILPSHLIDKLQKEGHPLHRFSGSGKPLLNTISIAELAEKSQSPAAAAALIFLKKNCLNIH